MSFVYLYPVTKSIYMVEDVGCSYKVEYGGGVNSFVERSKKMIDELMAYENGITPTYLTENTKAIHFHDCIVVYEVGKRQEHNTKAIGVNTL